MNKEQVNDVVFEALFSRAIIDRFESEVDSIPQNEELVKTYILSPEFEIRMKKLFAKNRRRTLFKNIRIYSRKIALIFIIALGLIFGTLLFNSEVRATVGNILVEWYEKFTSFTFRENEIISENKGWALGYLPEGYVQQSYEVLGRVTIIEYRNSQGEKIRFSYNSEGSITNISVDNENHEVSSSIILGNDAFFIKALNEKFDNGVIWNVDGHTFNLWGKLSIYELEKIAESIIDNK